MPVSVLVYTSTYRSHVCLIFPRSLAIRKRIVRVRRPLAAVRIHFSFFQGLDADT